MSPRPLALLVAPDHPLRRQLAGVLRDLGWRVRGVSDVFAATDAFVREGADLVVLSLDGFHRRDTPFLRLVRRRASTTPVLLLAPEGRRGVARRLLRQGASLVLPEPVHPEELASAVRALVPPRSPGPASPGADARDAVRSLGRELDHAIRNPLQVVSGLIQMAEQDATWDAAATAREAVERMSAALDVVSRYGRVGVPSVKAQHAGPLIARALDEVAKEGLVRSDVRDLPRGPLLLLDGEMVFGALADLLRFLAARAARRPLPVRAALRPTRRARLAARGTVAGSLPPGRLVEIAVQGKGLGLDPAKLPKWERRILWSAVRSRQPRPGLAVPALVARLHGGALAARASRSGTVLGLVLPRP